MFDPHRVGPQRSSSYSRNKGRVIQRRVVDTPSPGYTRTELEQLVPVMKRNGFIHDPYFGRMTGYTVIVNGVDISTNFVEVELNGTTGILDISETGEYMLVTPNLSLLIDSTTVVNVAMFTPLTFTATGRYSFGALSSGARLYQMGNSNFVDTLVLFGENDKSITMYIGHGRSYSNPSLGVYPVEDGSFAVPM